MAREIPPDELARSQAAAAAVGAELEDPDDIFATIRKDGHRYYIIDLQFKTPRPGELWGIFLVPPTDAEWTSIEPYFVKACMTCEEAATLAGQWGGFDPADVHILKPV